MKLSEFVPFVLFVWSLAPVIVPALVLGGIIGFALAVGCRDRAEKRPPVFPPRVRRENLCDFCHGDGGFRDYKNQWGSCPICGGTGSRRSIL